MIVYWILLRRSEGGGEVARDREGASGGVVDYSEPDAEVRGEV